MMKLLAVLAFALWVAGCNPTTSRLPPFPASLRAPVAVPAYAAGGSGLAALGAYRAGLLQANAQIAETGRWYDSLRSAAE